MRPKRRKRLGVSVLGFFVQPSGRAPPSHHPPPCMHAPALPAVGAMRHTLPCIQSAAPCTLIHTACTRMPSGACHMIPKSSDTSLPSPIPPPPLGPPACPRVPQCVIYHEIPLFVHARMRAHASPCLSPKNTSMGVYAPRGNASRNFTFSN